MNGFIKNLKTPIAIVGMGKSGEAAYRLMLNLGFKSDALFTFDGKPGTADFHQPETMMVQKAPQTLVVSPGVPLMSPWIQAAKKAGVKVTSEISIACSCLTTEKLIGVTGSVGKSTTVSILGAGLNSFSQTAFVGGNLGIPFASYAADILEGKRSTADWIILELSSYQLENCDNLNLDYSAITYFTSNHLERYENLEHYYRTKWHILSLTKNAMFINSEGGDLVEYYKANGVHSQIKITSKKDPFLTSLNLDKAYLIGQHNQDNLALASSLALAAGWPASAIDSMKSFKGLSHRLENLGAFNGIRFINDSKATAMDSVLIAASAAYESLSNSGKLILLLGGRDKNLPWQDLSTLKNFSNTEFVFFGECRETAKNKSELPGNVFSSLQLAMDYAISQAKMNDTVLLSPGGTSLDEFKSFEDRGNFFKNRVEQFARS